MLNEGMEALRQLATTSLFMQNEQKPALNRVVPVIREPEHATDTPMEMKKLARPLNVCDEEQEEEDIVLKKSRSKTQQQQPAVTLPTTTAEETCNKKSSKVRTRTTTPTKTTKTFTKQQTITSDPDEVSTPLTIDNKNVRQQQLPLTTTTASDPVMQETSLMVIEPTTSRTESRPATSVPITTTTTHTGAISRIPTSLTSYDLPPAKPHTYAAARSGDRADATPLIRGPLGMPLAALTASSSTYVMPSTSAQQQAKTLPASSSAPGAAHSSLYAATTTTIATPANTVHHVTFATKQQQQHIQEQHEQKQKQHAHLPGQIMDNKTTTNKYATVSASNKTSPMATTSNISFNSSAALASNYSSARVPSASKFEPELLLSPAKLGQ